MGELVFEQNRKNLYECAKGEAKGKSKEEASGFSLFFWLLDIFGIPFECWC